VSCMEPSEEQKLRALLAAAENRDVASTTKIWRGMTPTEQEGVLFTLLDIQAGQADRTEPIDVRLESLQEIGLRQLDDEPAIQADQTQLIPKGVEDLRGLTALDNEDANSPAEAPALPIGSRDYWSRWRQRWKWSVLVAVWAMATIFAFNGAFDSFGPREWAVSIFGSVILSGLLIGTLLDFLAAMIPHPTTASPERADR
jgi:hypothetical protein